MEKILNYWLEKIYDKIIELSSINRDILNATQASRYLSVKISWVYKLTSERRIRHFQPTGKLIYFKREDLDAFLLRNPIDTVEDIEKKMIQRASKNK